MQYSFPLACLCRIMACLTVTATAAGDKTGLGMEQVSAFRGKIVEVKFVGGGDLVARSMLGHNVAGDRVCFNIYWQRLDTHSTHSPGKGGPGGVDEHLLLLETFFLSHGLY